MSPGRDRRPEPAAPASDAAASPPGARGERLGPDEKLRRRAEFVRCYRQGRRRHGPLLNVHFARNELGHPRMGITASRKVGKAVVRQRLKRRLREIYRREGRRRDLPAVDLVLHLKPAAAGASFAELRHEVLRLLGSLAAGPERRDGGNRRRRRRR